MKTWIEGILPILDVGGLVSAERAPEVARALIRGGARALQLRAKKLPDRELYDLSISVRKITAEHGVLFFVNDRADIAQLSGADGVHLGQNDLPAGAVRRWLPPHVAIGVSCHSVQDADRVVAEGIAAYFGFGPVFPTTTKENPDPVVGLAGLAEVRRKHPRANIVAIGGITVEKLPAVRTSGASAAAMISGLLAAENVEEKMREAVKALQ